MAGTENLGHCRVGDAARHPASVGDRNDRVPVSVQYQALEETTTAVKVRVVYAVNGYGPNLPQAT